MKTAVKKLFVIAGKSGGHIIPALQIAQKWHENNNGGYVLLFTGSGTLDRVIAVPYSFLSKIVCLPLKNVPGKKLLQYPSFLLQLMYSFMKSFYFMIFFRPEKIISTGGYLALPLVITAWLLRVPVIMYEVNVVPGKAISWLSWFATAIHITFPATKNYFSSKAAQKCIIDTYPLRFSPADKNFDRAEILKKLNESSTENLTFESARKTVFIMGGSQGSEFINKLIISWLDQRNDIWPYIQIIHQVGSKNSNYFSSWYSSKALPAYTFSYCADVKDWYCLADVVVARGGAGTLFELEFFAKKSVIIPLKTVADNHQTINAHHMALRNQHLFSVLDQDDLAVDVQAFNSVMDTFLWEHRLFKK